MSLAPEIQRLILDAIPHAKVQVSDNGGGHYSISVVSERFAGLKTLDKKRLVLGSIAPLMQGADAPLHAVDQLDTITP